MLRIVIITLRFLLHEDTIDRVVAIGSLCGIWHGLNQIHPPTATVVTSSILLAIVLFSRVRRVPQ